MWGHLILTVLHKQVHTHTHTHTHTVDAQNEDKKVHLYFGLPFHLIQPQISKIV